MAANQDKAEWNCVYGHPSGCAQHKFPLVKGKPFKMTDHREELIKEGLTTQKQELIDDAKAGNKPPGAPTKVGKAHVYPARHFA